VLGITFKENCPDVRNTKVVDVIKNLEDFGTRVTIFDPWANPAEVLKEYGLTTYNSFPISANLNPEQSRREQQSTVTLGAVEGQQPTTTFDAIVLAVAHKEFLSMDLHKYLNKNGIIYDVKGVLKGKVHGKL
ncbi:MAG: UDP-glucose/GDP-mannose dehydrogenase family protein, partial [Lutibacter sp.]